MSDTHNNSIECAPFHGNVEFLVYEVEVGTYEYKQHVRRGSKGRGTGSSGCWQADKCAENG